MSTETLDASSERVDSLKLGGGSFTLMPERALREIIDTAHRDDVRVSTAGTSSTCSPRAWAPSRRTPRLRERVPVIVMRRGA